MDERQSFWSGVVIITRERREPVKVEFHQNGTLV
jgi:hypothetical protein